MGAAGSRNYRISLPKPLAGRMTRKGGTLVVRIDYLTLGSNKESSARDKALSREPNLARAKIGSPDSGSGCGSSLPRPESLFSEDAERAAGCEMALDVEDPMESG